MASFPSPRSAGTCPAVAPVQSEPANSVPSAGPSPGGPHTRPPVGNRGDSGGPISPRGAASLSGGGRSGFWWVGRGVGGEGEEGEEEVLAVVSRLHLTDCQPLSVCVGVCNIVCVCVCVCVP